jgi:hypothetical protein
VLSWLEEIAQVNLNIDVKGSVTFDRTLRSTAASRPPLPLDPDGPLRSGQAHIINRQDKEEENALLDSVWQYLRAGQLDAAIKLCRDFKQPW